MSGNEGGKPETGNWKLETGERKLETGNWKPESGNLKLEHMPAGAGWVACRRQPEG